MLVAAAQAAEPPELLSEYTSAGPAPEAAGAVGPKLRLLVSPVLACVLQTGFFWEPSLTVILWTNVVPPLKFACVEQQSPQTMKSAVFHAFCRFRTLSAAVAFAVPPGDVSTTVSVPPWAVPFRVVFCSCAAVIAGAVVLALLNQQLLPD
jgi:hypothetical protein